jgi:hypothetical protein
MMPCSGLTAIETIVTLANATDDVVFAGSAIIRKSKVRDKYRDCNSMTS